LNLKTKIVSLKLTSGEELITLSVMPMTGEDIEEAIESGFASFFHMLYPVSYSTESDSEFAWWIKSSTERCFRIPIDKVILVTDTEQSIKAKYAEMLERFEIDIDKVTEDTRQMVESFSEMMNTVDDPGSDKANSPKNVTIH